MDRGEWHHYAGDVGATKYSSLDQIDADNVGTLQIAWQRPAVDQSILDRVPELSYGTGLADEWYSVMPRRLARRGMGREDRTLWVGHHCDPSDGRDIHRTRQHTPAAGLGVLGCLVDVGVET